MMFEEYVADFENFITRVPTLDNVTFLGEVDRLRKLSIELKPTVEQASKVADLISRAITVKKHKIDLPPEVTEVIEEIEASGLEVGEVVVIDLKNLSPEAIKADIQAFTAAMPTLSLDQITRKHIEITVKTERLPKLHEDAEFMKLSEECFAAEKVRSDILVAIAEREHAPIN